MKKLIDKKLKYLYEMLEKYSKLNNTCRQTYLWREHAIENQIEALVELREGSPNNGWDEAFEEDLEESKQK